MDDLNSQQSHVLDILGPGPLQHVLERFAAILPFPLCVISDTGTLLAAVNFHESCQPGMLRFQIDTEQQRVEGMTGSPECPYQEMYAVPITFQYEVIGYVAALDASPIPHEKASLSALEAAASDIGEKVYSEYELQNLTEELIDRYNEVNLIYDISEALGAVLERQTVCNVIIEKAVAVIGVGKASVMLYDEGAERLYIAASHGFDLSLEELRKITVTPGEGVSGTVFSTGEHLLVENPENSLVPHLEFGDHSKHSLPVSLSSGNYQRHSFLCVPMICTPRHSEKKVMGVINMTDKFGSDMFTSGDVQLLKAISSQAAMSLYNIQLIEEVRDAERVKKEMEIAQQIQMGLLPGQPPDLPGVELAGRCLPATQVGGDYYDFFLSADNRVGLVIADVSGHNIGAALMMAVARSTLRSEVLTQKSPAQILQNTNWVLYEDLTHAELFITMFYAEYDINTRVLRYSNGGHNHPIVLREGSCSFLDAEGMLIGMLESVDFEEKTFHLRPNDFVIFYTDGVVEAVNEEGEMFKLERLCQVVESHAQQHAHELLDSIYQELSRYSGTTLRSDDITVVVLKIY